MSEVTYTVDNDYYDLFGISPAADKKEIARAHKRLAKACHPDLHPDKEWATERFKEINKAYAILKDPVTKGAYDRLRWAEVGKATHTERPKPAGPVKQPRKVDVSIDSDQHHRDRLMSYFILGIEVVVMTLFLVMGILAAIKKLKGM